MIAQTTFIYALTDPRTSEIRYVGKADIPKKRLVEYCNSSQLKMGTYKNKWIKGLLRKRLRPGVIVLEEIGVSCWEERERYWIKKLRKRGCCLTNMTDGGEGQSRGWKPPKTGLEKQSRAWKTGVPTLKMRETRRRRREERRAEKQQRFEEEMVRGLDLDQVERTHDFDQVQVSIKEEWFTSVLDALGELKQRELEVLRLRFGGHERVTLKKVGRRLGYTDGWVLLQEKEAMATLAELLKSVDFPVGVDLREFQCFLKFRRL